MKICFFINSCFPVYAGGRENWLYNVVSRLSSAGHDVSVVCEEESEGLPQLYSMPEKVKLISAKVPFGNRVFKKTLRGPLRIIHLFSTPLFFKKSLLSKEEGVDVFVFLDTVFTPLALPKDLGASSHKVIASKGPHAEVLAEKYPFLKRLFYFLEKRAFENADEIWSNGKDTEELIKSLGYDSVMIGNGLDTKAWLEKKTIPEEFFYKNKRSFKIVSIGSILPIKGVFEALHAIKNINQESACSVELFWVGKGDVDKYNKIAADLGVDMYVEFLGHRRDVRAYAQHADLLLCLSGGGGMSMAALESMASGNPVVAWDTPVYRQIINDGHSGFLAKYGDVSSLVETIKHVISLSQREREKVCREAEFFVHKQDWSYVVEKIQDRLCAL